MANARFDFLPPADENIVALHIYEASAALGPWAEIERVDAIGTFPSYIDSYLTDQATDPNDWFCIAWEDDAGMLGEKSPAVKGGTQTLVSQVVERVLQRDTSLEKGIVIQETEAALEMFLQKDPYEVEVGSLNYRQMNGIVYLVLARSLLWRMVQISSFSDVQVGLVRVSTRSGIQGRVDIQELFNLANAELGLNTSMILELQRVRDAENRPYYGQSRTYMLVLEP